MCVYAIGVRDTPTLHATYTNVSSINSCLLFAEHLLKGSRNCVLRRNGPLQWRCIVALLIRKHRCIFDYRRQVLAVVRSGFFLVLADYFLFKFALCLSARDSVLLRGFFLNKNYMNMNLWQFSDTMISSFIVRARQTSHRKLCALFPC